MGGGGYVVGRGRRGRRGVVAREGGGSWRDSRGSSGRWGRGGVEGSLGGRDGWGRWGRGWRDVVLWDGGRLAAATETKRGEKKLTAAQKPKRLHTEVSSFSRTSSVRCHKMFIIP